MGLMSATSLVARKPARETPCLTLLPEVTLPLARLHEACGPARMRMALWLAARVSGPVLWMTPSWTAERLNPCGLCQIVDPGRLIFVTATRPDDVLWCMEEILRAGAVALAVADLPGLPSLTQVRRMHLAAETGAREGAGHVPLGLLLTPGQGGAAGVETRWHLAAAHAAQPGEWHLSRLRARMHPPATWRVTQDMKRKGPRIEEHLPVLFH